MAFELTNIVPWGRNFEEYTKMFSLANDDLDKRIISFGDGPASFNAEMTQLNKTVVSIDPIYQFSKEELKQRITETKEAVIEQTRLNYSNFTWKNIRDIDHLEETRMNAMAKFIDDFEQGKKERRYVPHELPEPAPFNTLEFGLGLSSHFLLLYSQLGVQFHIDTIKEMLRICSEIRVFPILNLNAGKSEVLPYILEYFNTKYLISIIDVDYEFQKNGNKMLVIKHK